MDLSRSTIQMTSLHSGFHMNHHLSNSADSLPLATFAATQTDGRIYTLSAGSAHGVTMSSRFILSDPHAAKGGDTEMVASQVNPFSTILTPYDSYGSPVVVLPRVARAVQTSRGAGHMLGLCFSGNNYETIRLCKQGFSGSLYPTHEVYADILLHGDTRQNGFNTQVTFTLPRLSIRSAIQPFHIPYAIDFVLEQLSQAVRSMAHFRWHLSREPPEPILRNGLDATLVETNKLDRILPPLRDDEAAIDVKPDTEYILHLNNKSNVSLHVTVLLFDSDLSINACNLPGAFHGREVERLQVNGHSKLSIGSRGSSPFVFSVPDRLQDNVCFVKIFVSTEHIDLSFITQPSPFPSARAASVKKQHLLPNATRLHQDIEARVVPKRDIYDQRTSWDVITLPVRVQGKRPHAIGVNTSLSSAASTTRRRVPAQVSHTNSEHSHAVPSHVAAKDIRPVEAHSVTTEATPTTYTRPTHTPVEVPPTQIAAEEHATEPTHTIAEGTQIENKDIEPIDTPEKRTFPSMHAVIIGINAYACNAIGKRENNVPSELSPQIAVAPDLSGAVADADAVHDLLVQVLGVPLANITNLRNHQATREKIIQTLEGFAANDDIKRNDPILIYYAGHGATSKAPQEWSNANEIIQLLVPHDFSGRLLREPGVRSISNTTDVYGIPDRTFGALLNKISAAKGNNITVILDCCHSGSATRDLQTPHVPPNARSRGLELDVYTPPELDKDIVAHRPDQPSRTLWSDQTWKTMGLSSHVLLTACGSGEKAFEIENRGVFTKALISLLRSGVQSFTYSTLIGMLSDTRPKQNPQCEGRNQGRLLFDSRPAAHAPFVCNIEEKQKQWVLDAGEAQGIVAGAKFTIFDRSKVPSNQGTTVEVIQALPFSSVVKPIAIAIASSPVSPRLDWHNCFVSQSQPSGSQLLNIYLIDHEQRLRRVQSTIAQSSWITITPIRSNADLIIDVRDNQANFALQRPGTDHTFDLPYTANVRSDAVLQIIYSAAHYCWHLRRTPTQDGLRSKCTAEFYSLQLTDTYGDDLRNAYETIGSGLLDPTRGVSITADAEGTPFGLEIKTSSRVGLYAYAFIFDSDFSISSFYSPNSGVSGGRVDPCLSFDKALTLGYGSGGSAPLAFKRSGPKSDFAFAKVFLTTQRVDLSFMEQASPFPSTTTEPEEDYDISGTSRKGGLVVLPPPGKLWCCITIPIELTG
ncbi:hypothetical protein BDW22DRAFT_918059 [Trametopsis cervina]|nr:hypothetical protein BDW22DRAFT_918059 [Trametopsis cervina]